MSRKTTERVLVSYIIENQAKFYRVAYSYLKNQEDALDAVQAAVCRALEQQERLRDPDALRAWFYRILVNICYDQLRQRKRITLIEDPEILDNGSYQDSFPDGDDLSARIDALPLETATIIRLRFFEDLSLKEISAVTAVPLNTVKTRLYSGLRKLRLSLEGEDLYE